MIMSEIISFLKLLAESNTINFIIMAALLVWIVRKINLNSNFDKTIESVKESIEKSDDEKQKSEKILQAAKLLIDRLPEDVQTLEKNSGDKIEVFKAQIDEETQKTILNLGKNIDRAISIEEKKISNILTEKTAAASVELAKLHIIEVLKQNPMLHNQFVNSSLDELEKVKL